MRTAKLFTLISMILLLGSMPLPAQDSSSAQDKNTGIHRCVDASGRSVYTDAACSDIGATDKPVPQSEAGVVSQGYKPIITRACASTPEDLQWGVQSAIENNDVNRLAGFYEWTGFSSQDAEKVMNRLEIIAKQSLLSVEFIYPQIRRRLPTFENDDQQTSPLLPAEEVEPEYETYYGSNPVGMAIYQYADKKNQRASSSRFGVVQHKRCWWIRY
jgi:hypothetical protein